MLLRKVTLATLTVNSPNKMIFDNSLSHSHFFHSDALCHTSEKWQFHPWYDDFKPWHDFKPSQLYISECLTKIQCIYLRLIYQPLKIFILSSVCNRCGQSLLLLPHVHSRTSFYSHSSKRNNYRPPLCRCFIPRSTKLRRGEPADSSHFQPLWYPSSPESIITVRISFINCMP